MRRDRRPLVRVATASVLALTAASVALAPAGASGAAATRAGAAATETTHGDLPRGKVILSSAVVVNVDRHSATLPLHKGSVGGKTVWFILTESSDPGLADQLGLNAAPKLQNLLSCGACVQTVTLDSPKDNSFDAATVRFQGAPDFSPDRVLVPGPKVFPPAKAEPGGVGRGRYSPFIRIKGTSVVYNAPIVATGDGPFDVVHHSNTQDRVLAIHPGKTEGQGEFFGASVEMLLIRGFDSGKPIYYVSTESNDPVTAVLERATFVPLLGKTPFAGGDDFFGSGRERIFAFVNGPTGADNPQAQGLVHLIKDGHATEDANLGNQALIDALRNGGDARNVQGDFPTLGEANRENAYSPLWDATFGEWSDKAVAAGQNTQQTDEFRLLRIPRDHPELLTGPKGKPYGSTNVLINCPVIAFIDTVPNRDQVIPRAGDAVDTPLSYTP